MDVENTWMHGDHLIFKFKGVDTISDAEKLAGAEVAIPFEQRAELDEDEVYQSDLIGCEVFDATGRSLGRGHRFRRNRRHTAAPGRRESAHPLREIDLHQASTSIANESSSPCRTDYLI